MTLSRAVAEDFLDWQENQSRSGGQKMRADVGLLALYCFLTAALVMLVKCVR